MVPDLVGRQPRDGQLDADCIAGEQGDLLALVPHLGEEACVGKELQQVGDAGALGEARCRSLHGRCPSLWRTQE